MEKQEVEVTIGGNVYKITSPIKFKQLRIIDPAVRRFFDEKIKNTPESFDAIAEVIVVAVRDLQPEFARSVLDELPTNQTELMTAFTEIVKAAGMYKKAEEGAAGEAQGEVKT